MGKLDGKIAIVIGCAAPGGIGAATARTMAREGAKVVLADVVDGTEARADEIRQAGGDAVACKVDISDEESVKAMIAFAIEQYGGLDILHNNAAATGPRGHRQDGVTDLVDLDIEVWDNILAVNARGFVLTIKHAIPEMLKRGGGAIVNTSSQASLGGLQNLCCYASSKAAVNAITRHVATAYGKKGIRCNAVAPGLTLTDTVRKVFKPEFLEKRIRHCLTPRVGEPQDIANMVVFLASNDAAYVTGQVISVDGGQTAHLSHSIEMPSR